MTADEAAAYLGYRTRAALYQAVRRGIVPAHRLGARRLRFRRSELDVGLIRSGGQFDYAANLSRCCLSNSTGLGAWSAAGLPLACPTLAPCSG